MTPSPDGRPPRLDRRLLDAATEPYRAAGRFAYHFARGKLGRDPAFGAIVHGDWIAPGSKVLDLGCGQGLLAALLLAANRGCKVHGIELMPADVERARAALGDAARIDRGDIRDAAFGNPDVAVILDVLHYIDRAAQESVLRRLREALAPGGLLLLRVGDASAGWPFRLSNWVDRGVLLARGHGSVTLHCRPVADWKASLQALGFEVRAIALSHGTPFANVMLEARVPARAPAAGWTGRTATDC